MNEHDNLDAIFGPGAGNSALARARTSTRTFVRGLDQLSEARPKATGRRLTAEEALEAYGIDALEQVAHEGTVVLTPAWDSPGKVLAARRHALGLELRAVAKQARVSEDVIAACEASRRLPLRTYETVARTLGLDERFIGARAHAVGNESLTVRLRTIGDAGGALSVATVAALAEAAWVGATQNRLEAALGFTLNRHGLETSGNYGSPGLPAYFWGYKLAHAVRDTRALAESAPIESMRTLVEEHFGIPLIQTELGNDIAGATLESDGKRCIVVNLSGHNRDVLRRRVTIAHELGHLLFDPEQELESLRVDTYDDLDAVRERAKDRVEQRANAFAVELLAPQKAILERFKNSNLFECMKHFGIGLTAARYQIWNGADRQLTLQSITSPMTRATEQKELTAWEGPEAFTVGLPMHPLPGVRPSRQGRFCAIVLCAAERRLISWDTASEYLEVPEDAARAALPQVRELFPAVWPS